jgi:hypothetical protein
LVLVQANQKEPHMKFDRNGHRDDLWFAIALLVTTLAFGTLYIDSQHEMDRLAQAHHQVIQVAVGDPKLEPKR